MNHDSSILAAKRHVKGRVGADGRRAMASNTPSPNSELNVAGLTGVKFYNDHLFARVRVRLVVVVLHSCSTMRLVHTRMYWLAD